MAGPVDVVATQPGYYGCYRNVGDTFPVSGADAVSSVWMRVVGKDDVVETPAPVSDEAVDLSAMTDKGELEAYAKEHFGVDLDRRKSVENLRIEIQELIAAQ